MRENFKIVTNRILRDERTERTIIEMNRERFFYGMLLMGSVMLFLAILW
jgi:hypothetical protein